MISINGCNKYDINCKRFTDGTLKMTVDTSLSTEQEMITWKYESDSELFELICLVKHLKSEVRGIQLSLYMPYLPNARMDRAERGSDVFTLKYFAEIINSLDFYKVYVLDVHSEVSTSLINRCVNILPKNFIDRFIWEYKINKNEDMLVFPDAGSMKRYQGMFDFKNIVIGQKQRDWETGKVKSLNLLGNIKVGAKVLFIDDICANGDTACEVLEKLRKFGAGDCYCWFTHLEKMIYTDNVRVEGKPEPRLLTSGLVKAIGTTNSLLNEVDMLRLDERANENGVKTNIYSTAL